MVLNLTAWLQMHQQTIHYLYISKCDYLCYEIFNGSRPATGLLNCHAASADFSTTRLLVKPHFVAARASLELTLLGRSPQKIPN